MFSVVCVSYDDPINWPPVIRAELKSYAYLRRFRVTRDESAAQCSNSRLTIPTENEISHSHFNVKCYEMMLVIVVLELVVRKCLILKIGKY